MLENARVGTPPDAEQGKATHGTIVTVKFPDGDTETFLLGSREEAAHTDVDVYSPTSPLGGRYSVASSTRRLRMNCRTVGYSKSRSSTSRCPQTDARHFRGIRQIDVPNGTLCGGTS